MVASRKSLLGLAAAVAFGALAAGCGETGGFGSFSGAKEVFLGKPTATPELPDRPKLVMPPSNAALPVPGQAAPARPQWTAAAQDPNKPQQPQETAAAKQESSGWFSGLFGSSEKKSQ
jgi:hypothetical protein